MLKRIGVSVPRAVCLTTDFYRHWLDVSGFGPRLTELVATAGDADVRRKILEQIRCEVEATPLSADAEAALRQGIGRVTLGRDGDVLSVRSSGVDEDHLDASHAGLHTSRIVPGHDRRAIIATIKPCWASVSTATAWTYRARLGIPTAAGTLGTPVDLEWVCDGDALWAVQARPITTLTEALHASAHAPTLWTRANLKEVFPELPSPLALSYLTLALNRMFRTYHAAHGYSVAPDSRLVCVIHGRPYLNLSLMQQMTIERGGDPAIVGRLFGGASPVEPRPPAPASRPELPRSGRARLAREMLATFLGTPYRGHRLFRGMRRRPAALDYRSLEAP